MVIQLFYLKERKKKMNNEDKIPVGRAENLTNKRFGRLVILYRVKSEGKKTKWKCKCDCGNITIVRADQLKNGTTQSCGCLNTEKRIENCNKRNLEKANQIFNLDFQYIVPLRFAGVDNHQDRIVECQCICGNIFFATLDHLKSGHTQSCGCQKGALISQAHKKDLKNLRFGKLIALESKKTSDGYWGWKCQCDCGNIKIVRTGDLINGHVKSCGCLISAGELKINEILSKNFILYETQKTFDDLVYENGKKHRFDFYINNSYLIEFDGKQHYIGWSGKEENLLKQQERDNIKNNYCKENNIPLIRIPYTKLETLQLEDLLLETTQFRVV